MILNNHRATLKDVARAAGVSASTVSRALKNDLRISPAVTKRIKQIAKQVGYIPDITARSLRTGRTNTIGLLVRDISDEWSAALIPFIEKECTALNYALLLSNADSDPEREKYYLKVFQQRNVEGILILTPVSSNQDDYLRFAQTTPLVLVDIALQSPKINAVTVDHELGAFLSTQHLIDLRHREIAFISGPLNLSPSQSYRDGFLKALIEYKIQNNKKNFIATEKIDIAHGYQAMQELIQKKPSLTAVATGSDLMAAGAMKAIKEYGFSIPNDISIIGYDDIPLSDLLTPPLSSVKQDRQKLGQAAIELLTQVINSEIIKPKQITIPPELILRKSTSLARN